MSLTRHTRHRLKKSRQEALHLVSSKSKGSKLLDRGSQGGHRDGRRTEGRAEGEIEETQEGDRGRHGMTDGETKREHSSLTDEISTRRQRDTHAPCTK